MKNLLISSSIILFYFNLNAQTTVILQPDGLSGIDAEIWFLNTQSGTFGATNSLNNPDEASFQAMEWTWNGSPGTRKSLLDFDISIVPPGALISSAKLSLYAFPNSTDGGHSSLSGSNSGYLQEILSAWTESTVTWNNQPTVSSSNQISLAQSVDEFEDYIDIDVTAIILNKYSNPSASHGFMLSIANSQYYRSMIFGSSDHQDPNKRPKLEITYTTTANLNNISENLDFLIYPNPSNGTVYVNLKSEMDITVMDMMGRNIIPMVSKSKGPHLLDLSNLAKGVYFVRATNGLSSVTKKLELE